MACSPTVVNTKRIAIGFYQLKNINIDTVRVYLATIKVALMEPATRRDQPLCPRVPQSNSSHKHMGEHLRMLFNKQKIYIHKSSNYISRLISSDNNNGEKLGNIFTHFGAVICRGSSSSGALCGGCCVNLRHNCKPARMGASPGRWRTGEWGVRVRGATGGGTPRGQLRRLVMTAMTAATAAAASAFE